MGFRLRTLQIEQQTSEVRVRSQSFKERRALARRFDKRRSRTPPLLGSTALIQRVVTFIDRVALTSGVVYRLPHRRSSVSPPTTFRPGRIADRIDSKVRSQSSSQSFKERRALARRFDKRRSRTPPLLGITVLIQRVATFVNPAVAHQRKTGFSFW
jgi:hypothetical protein